MVRLRVVPARLSSFVGRKKELAEVRRLLTHTRLLTILGPGGAGKTRLSQEYLARHVPEAAVFAELGDVAEGALIVETIARAAGVRLEGEDRAAALARGLVGCRVLVVDNCEHLVDAAAEVVRQLLTACPGLKVIATSRERLNLEGEVAWTIPPLGVPTAGDDVAAADTSDAARLFVDRARSVRPGFGLDTTNSSAVLAICRRLDGIPLAIELAAARMTTLSPSDLLPRLEASLELLTGGNRGAVSRQRTLRATIDWSYGLLDLSEQRVLQRMSVFAGAPDAEAVQEVCAFPPLDQATVLDALGRLVDQSMVQVDTGETMRYRLLETIREYAAEKLVAAQEADDARDHHLARYRRLANEAYELRRHRGAAAEHRRLWREMSDVRAALDRARADSETELEMVGSLYLVWMSNAPLEGYERATEALARATPSPSLGFLSTANAWHALGGLTGRGPAQVGKAGMRSDMAVLAELTNQSEDKFFLATFTGGMAYTAERQGGSLDDAHDLMEGAVALFESLGPGPSLAMSLGSLGSLRLRTGRPDSARGLIERSVAMTREVDDQFGAIGAHFHLGHLELQTGSRERALSAFVAGLEFVEPADTLSTTGQIQGVACALETEDPGYALRLFSAAARLRGAVAARYSSPWDPRIEDGIERARAALPAVDADVAWTEADDLTLEGLLAEVLARFRAPTAGRKGPAQGLSRREMEVAELVAAGMTSRAIGDKLFLSERTVETHLTHVMTKLGFNSRAQVAAWVAEQRAAG